jgi:NMD protein affecting ribosome stability and mRNA decay
LTTRADKLAPATTIDLVDLAERAARGDVVADDERRILIAVSTSGMVAYDAVTESSAELARRFLGRADCDDVVERERAEMLASAERRARRFRGR